MLLHLVNQLSRRESTPSSTNASRSFKSWALPALAGICISVLATPNGLIRAQDVATEDPAGATKKTDPGQNDLDEAVIARIDAETDRELDRVKDLLKGSIKKGLGEENKAFANKMLGSISLQQAQNMAAQMLRSRGRARMKLLDEAMDTLDEAVKFDPTLVEAYLLIARLNLMPDGDRDAIVKATSKAIELLKGDPVEQSAAYVLRALTYGEDEDDKRLEDLNAATKADPNNLEAYQSRAALKLRLKDVDGAIEDLERVLAKDPTNEAVAETAVRQLVEINRVEAALELITKTLKAKPTEGMYRMRAILYRMEGKEEEALGDLNKALAMQPSDPMSLLQRAEIALGRGEIKSAKEDLRSATKMAPRLAQTDQAIYVRCMIAVEENRMADAINDMSVLVERDPSNELRQIQLSRLYQDDKRPRKAIEGLTAFLDRDPKNVAILRSRGDAYLNVGDHKNAIADYEMALKRADDDADKYDLPGILNNLAWVLATSPSDGVRDGKRAVELGKRAVKLTEEKEAHILSTLAAGFAEAGDFDKAIEWSTKSVNLGKEGDHEQLEQLEDELENYKQRKPWREKQEVEENKVPILDPKDLIDT